MSILTDIDDAVGYVSSAYEYTRDAVGIAEDDCSHLVWLLAKVEYRLSKALDILHDVVKDYA